MRDRAMTCDRAARQIYPSLDGALPPAARRALDAHLAGCAGCRALATAEIAFRARWAELLGQRPPAPEALHERLRAELGARGAPEPTVAPARRPTGRLRRLARSAFGAAAAAALAGLLLEPAVRERSVTPALVRSVAAQQAALATGRLPLEVTSGSSGTVAAWLGPRIGFPVELPSEAGPGIEVQGARLTELATAEAAAVVYRVDGRSVVLFTFPAAALEAIGARHVVALNGHRFHEYRLQGLTVTVWQRGAAGYALATPDDVAASRGCAACHTGDQGRRLDEAFRPRSAR